MDQPHDAAAAPVPQQNQTPAMDSGMDPELSALQSQMLELQGRGQNGANWFYWAAGLSLVNSLIAVAGGNRRFIFGLGITSLSDLIGQGLAEDNPNLAIGKFIAFGFALFVCGVMVGFGWLANKRITPLFALGMGLYLLDGLLLLFFQDFISVAFHAFVLYQMWQGLMAYRQLSLILRSQPAIA